MGTVHVPRARREHNWQRIRHLSQRRRPPLPPSAGAGGEPPDTRSRRPRPRATRPRAAAAASSGGRRRRQTRSTRHAETRRHAARRTRRPVGDALRARHGHLLARLVPTILPILLLFLQLTLFAPSLRLSIPLARLQRPAAPHAALHRGRRIRGLHHGRMGGQHRGTAAPAPGTHPITAAVLSPPVCVLPPRFAATPARTGRCLRPLRVAGEGDRDTSASEAETTPPTARPHPTAHRTPIRPYFRRRRSNKNNGNGHSIDPPIVNNNNNNSSSSRRCHRERRGGRMRPPRRTRGGRPRRATAPPRTPAETGDRRGAMARVSDRRGRGTVLAMTAGSARARRTGRLRLPLPPSSARSPSAAGAGRLPPRPGAPERCCGDGCRRATRPCRTRGAGHGRPARTP